MRRGVTGVLLAVLAVAGSGILTGCGGSTPVALVADDAGTHACVSAESADEWTARHSRGTEFGINYLTVNESPVVIDSATLLGAHDLRLTDLAFVRGGGQGGGAFFGDPAFSASPAVWAARAQMPDARLTNDPPATAAAGTAGANPDAAQWQAVVGVAATGTATVTWADGVELTYRTNGGDQQTVDLRFPIGISQNGVPCRTGDDESVLTS